MPTDAQPNPRTHLHRLATLGSLDATTHEAAAGSERSGGPRGGCWTSARARRRRIPSTTFGSRMNAMMRISPPHAGQRSGSTSYTRLISSAQRRRNVVVSGGGVPGSVGRGSSPAPASRPASIPRRLRPVAAFEYAPWVAHQVSPRLGDVHQHAGEEVCAVRVMLPARAWSHEVVGPALDRVVALVRAVRRGGSGLTSGPREAPYCPARSPRSSSRRGGGRRGRRPRPRAPSSCRR